MSVWAGEGQHSMEISDLVPKVPNEDVPQLQLDQLAAFRKQMQLIDGGSEHDRTDLKAAAK